MNKKQRQTQQPQSQVAHIRRQELEVARIRRQEIEHRKHGVCSEGCPDCPDQAAANEREVVCWEIEQELDCWYY